MTEVSESFFRNTLKDINSQLSDLQAEYKSLGGDSRSAGSSKCCVNTKQWTCCDKPSPEKSYGKWLNVRDQINFLKGQVNAAMKLLSDFLKSEKAEGKDDAPKTDDGDTGCSQGCDGADKPNDSSADPANDPAPTPTPDKTVDTEVTESTADQYDFLDESAFKSHVKSFLGKENGEVVSEERLYHATVAFLLEGLHGTEARSQYEEVRTLPKKGTKSRVEKATKDALRELRDSGTISSEDADKIHSMAFYASQLDTNHGKLGTKASGATKGVRKAADDAFTDITAMLKGGLEYSQKSL